MIYRFKILSTMMAMVILASCSSPQKSKRNLGFIDEENELQLTYGINTTFDPRDLPGAYGWDELLDPFTKSAFLSVYFPKQMKEHRSVLVLNSTEKKIVNLDKPNVMPKTVLNYTYYNYTFRQFLEDQGFLPKSLLSREKILEKTKIITHGYQTMSPDGLILLWRLEDGRSRVIFFDDRENVDFHMNDIGLTKNEVFELIWQNADKTVYICFSNADEKKFNVIKKKTGENAFERFVSFPFPKGLEAEFGLSDWDANRFAIINHRGFPFGSQVCIYDVGEEAYVEDLPYIWKNKLIYVGE